MARILFCCLLITVSFISQAQQNRFIYIQTENKQSFYVKVDKKVFSSSASGYVIIPQLKDGSYNLSVGFPKNEWPEQTISCRVDKKDAGFMLKNFGEKGWGLFNLQTLEVLMAGNTAGNNAVAVTENKKDEFSNMLSNAVNDSTIRKAEVVKPAEKKEEPKEPAVTAEVKKAPAVVKAPAAKVSRLLYVSGKEGVQMIYADVNNGKADTIRILIPAEKETPQAAKPVKEEITSVEPPVKKEEPKEAVKEPAAAKEKFIDIELPNPNAKQDNKPVVPKEPAAQPAVAPQPAQAMPEPVAAKKVTMINSNCKNYAVEDDFLKLRKKMAAEDNDDDMVAVARKTFKTKCFTTQQLKNLCVLFLKDEGRYKFFDAAYPFVSDSENFSTLSSQLSDEYYINRFNAMVKH
jgi:Domain of unknown function (DUF4476)